MARKISKASDTPVKSDSPEIDALPTSAEIPEIADITVHLEIVETKNTKSGRKGKHKAKHVDLSEANVARYRVKPGDTVALADLDADDHSAFDVDKAGSKEILLAMNNELEALQELLFAEGKHKVLIVIQATDTGGKDGTIQHVFDGVNPQGVEVAAFKVPTPDELAHDFLWRVHQRTPGRGKIVIFNRSHYEDVLVVRVHNLVPEQRWRKRYEQINNFEAMLAAEGTTIIKIYLHISKDEQAQRLQDRLDDPEKHWKFSVGDLAERELWDQYQAAANEMLSKTSTDEAPWYVIPANRKWYRNLVVSRIVIDTLKGLNMAFPEPADLSDVVIK